MSQQTARSLSSARSNDAPKSAPHSVQPGSPSAILSQAQTGRLVVEDFCPLSESLEWELGQQYLRERGNKAFISDAAPVPFVINNDGTLSQNAAEVFFASLVEADSAGTLTGEIFVLELGIGVGLFARYFLESFRDLCQKHDKDYYDRLCYIAADKSERMLLDVLRHGVLANHPGRWRVRQVDALEPEKILRDVVFGVGQDSDPVETSGQERNPILRASEARDGQERNPVLRGSGAGDGQDRNPVLRAVFLNYLLDCLPAAMLEHDGDSVKQLCVRTCVARNVRLEDFTDMKIEQLNERAKSHELRDRQELLEVYGLFASEYDYRPVDVATLPHGQFTLDFARKRSKRLLHNYGAIHALEKLLDMVADGGFVLVNDYGQTQITRDDEFEHQRFSLATFVGVKFPLLKAFFGEAERCQFFEPSGEERGIHSRLLGRGLGTDTITRFYECFGTAAADWRMEPLNQARACAKVGRFELAADFYNEALKRQPRNWLLLNEISMFLTFSLRDPKAGIDMAKLSLSLNPTCSAELWSTLGDGLYEWGRTAEARSAYLKALDVNPTDVRARFNLAWVHTREKNFPDALECIAQALALDKTGEYRERLLQKQNEILAQAALRHQQEYLLLINLVSKYAKPEDKGKTEEPPRHSA